MMFRCSAVPRFVAREMLSRFLFIVNDIVIAVIMITYWFLACALT